MQEHLEEQKQKLFGQFCDPRHEEEVFIIREEAKAKRRRWSPLVRWQRN